MHNNEKDAIAAICLMAAVADGGKIDVEHFKLREISESLGIETSATIAQRVLLHMTTLRDEATALSTPEIRMMAFEMAVCICDADGMTTLEEQEFLKGLRDALSIPSAAALETQCQAEGFARAAFEDARHPVLASRSVPQAVHANEPSSIDAAVDNTILKHAILVGGLELLPQSLSTMAILPLQMKLVYTIGTRYGYQLDGGHVREFLAVLGVGMTSQILEGVVRKFLGSLTKRVGRHMMGDLSGAATGAAITFAATYGLGMAAKKYYASGRNLSMADVKTLFAQSSEEAKGLYLRYAGQVEQSAKSTNVSNLLSMVRSR